MRTTYETTPDPMMAFALCSRWTKSSNASISLLKVPRSRSVMFKLSTIPSLRGEVESVPWSEKGLRVPGGAVSLSSPSPALYRRLTPTIEFVFYVVEQALCCITDLFPASPMCQVPSEFIDSMSTAYRTTFGNSSKPGQGFTWHDEDAQVAYVQTLFDLMTPLPEQCRQTLGGTEATELAGRLTLQELTRIVSTRRVPFYCKELKRDLQEVARSGGPFWAFVSNNPHHSTSSYQVYA
jgi:hypothetical protein